MVVFEDPSWSPLSENYRGKRPENLVNRRDIKYVCCECVSYVTKYTCGRSLGMVVRYSRKFCLSRRINEKIKDGLIV